MQLDFIFNRSNRTPAPGFLMLETGQVPIVWRRNPHARRYVLRFGLDGVARVTIPRGGSLAEAQRFAERHRGWLEQQSARLAARPAPDRAWRIGMGILFRGEEVKLRCESVGQRQFIALGDECIRVTDPAADLRPSIERHLWKLAARELPARVFELAELHQLAVQRVTVRNQRSRWGSCSRRGTISLNWRLIQSPPFIRDYIILHELMHLRQMNHSDRFWREVERVCPEYGNAEKWLKQHAALLR